MDKTIPVPKAKDAAPRCYARASLLKALRIAAEAITREFSLTESYTPSGDCCLKIREEWDSWCDRTGSRIYDKYIMRGKEKRHRKYLMMVKGTKRIFDVPCVNCDRLERSRALEVWKRRVAGEYRDGETHCSRHLDRLKVGVRELTHGWGSRLKEARLMGLETSLPDEYTPDRQGCLEVKREFGGTLAVDAEYRTDDYSVVRVGCAKQKGKLRVVTMQSAYVKRVLTPVHKAIYDHISSFGWCVRGDVTREDFERVTEFARERGEPVISGDYDAATDNIYRPAVEAVVDELSKSPHLTEEERNVLMGSFVNLRWRDNLGVERPINRGSMMGNLCSFPILCILNKVCHDIAADMVYGPGQHRIGRFNGDDCMFAGNDRMYQSWREVTSWYGFKVNEKKTLVSYDWADLNSQCYDIAEGRLIGKPVLSFLRPMDDKPGECLSSIISGIASLRVSVQLWLVNVHARYLVSLKGFSPSNLPSFWVNALRKRRWFRRACLLDQATPGVRPRLLVEKESKEVTIIYGETRDLPQVIGVPPKPKVISQVDSLCRELERLHRDCWTGVKVHVGEPVINRKDFRKTYDECRRIASDHEPMWLGWNIRYGYRYPKVIWELISEMPHLLCTDADSLAETFHGWSDRLTLQYSFVVRRSGKLRFVPPPRLPPSDPRFSPFSPGLNQVF